ncbi:MULTISPECIES: YolD-like family protein [Allobacillus]|uniref:YolD-like family protein n=1 Tax=Allobacillus salarius TaxID=1955272 RepID=A0A556PS75_9BACI|nr:YolD-like family protein [Allobacillus salarius]TSJ67236.1 YolD-like family protein [Allobacillus salarius]
MHKDRGTMKWSSLMLPEHVEILQGLWQEDRYEKKPTVDEQQIEWNEQLLQQAYINQSLIQVTHYDAGAYYKELLRVMYMEPSTRSIRFTDQQDNRKTISIENILQIE